MEKDISQQIIYDAVKEVREEQKDLKSDINDFKRLFEKHLESDERMYSEFTEMNQILKVNTHSLELHMKRSDTNEKMYQDHHVLIMSIVDRLNRVEQPMTVKQLAKLIVKISAGITAIAGAAYGVKELFLK